MFLYSVNKKKHKKATVFKNKPIRDACPMRKKPHFLYKKEGQAPLILSNNPKHHLSDVRNERIYIASQYATAGSAALFTLKPAVSYAKLHRQRNAERNNVLHFTFQYLRRSVRTVLVCLNDKLVVYL